MYNECPDADFLKCIYVRDFLRFFLISQLFSIFYEIRPADVQYATQNLFSKLVLLVPSTYKLHFFLLFNFYCFEHGVL